MGSLGMGELLVILVIVLLIFGAGKLPQIGDSLGKSIRNFKNSMSKDHNDAIEVKKKKELTAGRRTVEDDDDADDDVEVAAAPKSKKQQS